MLANKNRAKTWEYGYNEKYDFVCISKNGKVGDVVEISGLRIGLPAEPKNVLPGQKNQNNIGKDKSQENLIEYSLYFSNEMPGVSLKLNGLII